MGSRDERARSRTALLLGVAVVLAPPPGQAAVSEVERLRQELDSTKQALSSTQAELAATRDTLADLVRRVDSLQVAPEAEPEPAATTARLVPVNADNPGISFAVDTLFASDTNSSDESIGFRNGAGFVLKNAELFVSAPIDPFLRGYASINGSSDEGFNVEEAALITTALPYGFTIKGGRFFADFGRLPHWHDEALPFVYRPSSIERLIGGESIAEGAEFSWLAPTEHFIEVTGGVYNAVGADPEEVSNFVGRRSFNELTYLVHPHTYFDLTDTLNAEVGASWLGVPQNGDRSLWGVDLTLRHQPGTSRFYQGLVWGSEWLWNSQVSTEADRARFVRNGGYTYAEAFFGRRYSTGLLFDYSEAPDGEVDLEKTLSAFVTWQPSEFQRLRFQFDNAWGDQPSNQRFTLQWTAFLGSHSHGFAQR
jgi:hypothetical protein